MSCNPLQFQYITTDQAVTDLINAMSAQHIIAMDIEADSFHHYYPKVCLIQLSFDGENFVIDPLSDIDLSEFFIHLSPKRLIFHDAGYDLRMLRLSFGFEPKGEIFDTMLAGKLLQLEPLNLAGMLQQILNVTISKGSQKADWSKRPLPDHLLNYAALDTHHLLELALKLEERLSTENRSGWHKQMCQRSVRSAINHKPDNNPERDWRIKGSSLLSRRQLAFLKHLWLWREKQAQQADLPPFRILHNERLIDMAVHADTLPEPDFTDICSGLKHCKGKRLNLLIEALGKAFAQTESQWPLRRESTRQPRPDPEILKRAEQIKECCKIIAESHHVASDLLLPKALINLIAKSGPDHIQELLKQGLIVPWQAELLEEPVRKCF